MSKRSKIQKYAKSSDLMNIRIKYEGENFKFNLFDELVIDENKINSELKDQPSYFGFLSLLLTKLSRMKDDREAELNKIRGSLYVDLKKDINPDTQRPYSNDLVEMMIEDDNDYQAAVKKLNRAKEQYSTVYTCVKSFEQRKDLIQSISANLRKEQ